MSELQINKVWVGTWNKQSFFACFWENRTLGRC